MAFKKSRLHAAQEQHQRQVEELQAKKYLLPSSIAEMRALLTKR
jgi:hypothetical protein